MSTAAPTRCRWCNGPRFVVNAGEAPVCARCDRLACPRCKRPVLEPAASQCPRCHADVRLGRRP